MTDETQASSATTSPGINLLETSTFTQTVKCQLPGEGADSNREFSFRATYKAMPQDEWEELVEDANKSEALAAVLVDVDGVHGGTLPDGTRLTGAEVVARNPFTCDAAFATYAVYTSRNGRDIAQSAAERKNSRRSRRR